MSSERRFNDTGSFTHKSVSHGLLGVTDGAGFTDDGDFDLSGIGHLVLDAASDVGAEHLGLLVVNLLGTDDDAEFATRLDGVGLGDTWKQSVPGR